MSTPALTLPTDMVTEKSRISSIDLVRGIVMVIMALDHSRDFFHTGAFTYDATNLQTTTPVLFFTRWITHFCAPAFVLLAGTSIFINTQKKSKKDLSVFLLTRGLWLILLEVVVIRFSFFFNFYYDLTVLQVIWVIGAAMVCMAALIHLPFKVLLTLGAVIVLGHNTTDFISVTPADNGYVIWAFLEKTGFMPIADGVNLLVFYPLVPWLGIMMLGYCLGALYQRSFDVERRQKMLMTIGACAVIAFVLLRLTNWYGDPQPWSSQKDGLFTFMSFLNCQKYPPSLLYTLMTLGPVLIALSLLERVTPGSLLRPFIVFGRVPLFYYILHFYLIHAIALMLFMNKTGTSFSQLDFHFSNGFGGITGEGGYSLTVAYVLWLGIVIFLYPVCRWYNAYKSTHKSWWLSYL